MDWDGALLTYVKPAVEVGVVGKTGRGFREGTGAGNWPKSCLERSRLGGWALVTMCLISGFGGTPKVTAEEPAEAVVDLRGFRVILLAMECKAPSVCARAAVGRIGEEEGWIMEILLRM